MKILYSIADCRPVADASLTGLGVSLYRLTEFFVLEFFEFFDGIGVFFVNNESRRQNTIEFFEVILGLLLSLRFQLNNFSYHLHGDSASLLTWAKADRINCTVARQANLVFTTVSMHFNATVAGTQET